MKQKFDYTEVSDIARYLDIAKKHLDIAKKEKEAVFMSLLSLDSALVSSIFSAAAVEAALNLYLCIPALYIKDKKLKSFFSIMTSKYLRLSIPQKINFVCEFEEDIKKSKSLRNDLKKLFSYRNVAVHSSPEIWADELWAGSTESSDDVKAARIHYDTAIKFIGMLHSFRPDRLSLKKIKEIECEIGQSGRSILERVA